MESMGIADKVEFHKALSVLKESRVVVCLTGAGISVPSGIPPFRGHGGLWERFDPSEYAHIQAFRKDPQKLWTLMHPLYRTIQKAKPNPAHLALAQLEKIGRIRGIITQNIDGLHQKAGSRNVIEYHGSMDKLVCLNCGVHYALGEDFASKGEVPLCPECLSPLKPDIVLFGEPIPKEALRATQDLVSMTDTLLVVGSSCTVTPAAELPFQVVFRKGRVIEVNPLQSAITNSIATVSLKAPAEEALPILAQALLETKAPLGAWGHRLGPLGEG